MKIKRLLAWLLAFTMFWQSAGIEVMAASAANGLEGAEDTEIPPGDGTGEKNSSGELPGADSEDSDWNPETGGEENTEPGEKVSPSDSEGVPEEEDGNGSDSETPKTEEEEKEPIVQEDTEEPSDAEILPVADEISPEEVLEQAEASGPLYWIAEAVSGDDTVLLTDAEGQEGFEDFSAAAAAIAAHAGNGEGSGYTYRIRRNPEVENDSEELTVGSLGTEMPAGVSVSLLLEGGQVQAEAGAVISYAIAGGTDEAGRAGILKLPEGGTVTVQSKEQVSLSGLQIQWPANQTVETLVLESAKNQDAEVFLDSVALAGASGQDVLEIKGNVKIDGAEELSVPVVKIHTENGRADIAGHLAADALELDGSLEAENLTVSSLKATDASELRLHGIGELEELSVATSGEEHSFAVILSEAVNGATGEHLSMPELQMDSIVLEDGALPVCVRREIQTLSQMSNEAGEHWWEKSENAADFGIGDVLLRVPAERAEEYRSCFMVEAEWQRVEAVVRARSEYAELSVEGMNDSDPLWIWLEPQTADEARTPIGSVSTFAKAKEAIADDAYKKGPDNLELQSSLNYTIDVRKTGIVPSGTNLDFSDGKYHVSVSLNPLEEKNRTLTVKGAVTFGGNLSIEGSIKTASGSTVTIKTPVDDHGDHSQVEISGALTVTGNLVLNGELIVNTLSVSGTTTAQAEMGLHVKEKGTLTNLTVKGGSESSQANDTFRIGLGNVSSETANFIINGKVTKSGSMLYPVTFIKEDEEGSQADFVPGDVLAQVHKTTSYAPVECFQVGGNSDVPQCVVRTGNLLKVDGTSVRVTFSPGQGEIFRDYPTMKAAVAGISAATSVSGFGKKKGIYEIKLLTDCTLDANLTVPDCVTELILSGAGGTENGNRSLDLNSKTLTVNGARIYIGDGLTVRNGKLTASKATEIEGEIRTQGEGSSLCYPVEGTLTLTAANAEMVFSVYRTDAAPEGIKEEFPTIPYDLPAEMPAVSLNVKKLELDYEDKWFSPELTLKALTLNAGATYIRYGLTVNTLTMKTSRLMIERSGSLNVNGTMTVSSAYARDTGNGYYTVENDGGIVKIGTLNMTAGILYNRAGDQINTGNTEDALTAVMEIDTVKRAVKFYNGEGAVFRTHSFTQAKGDKTWFLPDSRFVIYTMGEDGNKDAGKAVIYNPVLEGSSFIEKDVDAKVSVYGTPSYNSGTTDGRCTFLVSGTSSNEAMAGAVLFSVESTSGFPIEMFGIERMVSNPDHPDEAEEVEQFYLVQSGKNIQINRALFVLHQEGVNGDKYLGSFITWAQVSACITAMNDATADYRVDVYPDNPDGIVNIGAALALPSKARHIYFEYEDEDEWTPANGGKADRCTLIYYGNLNLTTHVTFHNFILKPQKSAKDSSPTAVTLNSKELIFWCSAGTFASITGKSKSILEIIADPFTSDRENVYVTGAVSGVTDLKLSGLSYDNESEVPENQRGTLHVKGALTATNLYLYHGEVENPEFTDAAGKPVLNDTGAAYLNGNSKVTLTNVYVEGTDTRISCGGNTSKNWLDITGTVSSSNEEIAYGEAGDCLWYKENAITVEPKSLSVPYADDAVLLQAAKAQAAWFVYAENGEKHYTVKNAKLIRTPKTGETGLAVELCIEGAGIRGYYRTVKEAFAEITALNNAKAEYEVKIFENSATSIKENLTFPSKAAKLTIQAAGEGSEGITFSYKNLIEIKCRTEFSGTALQAGAKSTLKLGNFELRFTDCDLQEAKTGAVSGTASKAVLVLDNSNLAVTGDVKNLKTLEMVEPVSDDNAKPGEDVNKDIHVDITGSMSGIGTLIMGRKQEDGEKLSAELTVTKTMSVTSIESRHENCGIHVNAVLTRDKKGTITSMAPGLTIGGTVTGCPVTVMLFEQADRAQCVRFYDMEEGNSAYIWGAAYKSVSDFGETEYKGIRIASAKKASADMILASPDNIESGKDGMLYKSGGFITYMSTADYAVSLSYEGTDGNPADTPCLTLADAVTEINNLSTARDYIIKIREDIGTEETAAATPVKLTLPSKGKAKTVTITSDSSVDSGVRKICYQGNITSNTNLTLERIALVQKVSRKNGKVTEWINASENSCPAAVTLTIPYQLTVGADVSFNTPLALNGGNAGTLILTRDSDLVTNGAVSEKTENSGYTVISGTVSNFKEVQVSECEWEVLSYAKNASAQTGGTISVQNMTMQVSDLELSGALTVSKALIVDNSTISNRSGNITIGTLSMVSQSNESRISSAASMTVNGNVNSRGRNNTLSTVRKNAAAAPTLTIKGNLGMVIVNSTERSPLQIQVMCPGADGQLTPLVLESSSQLLTAAKGTADFFEVADVCLKEGNKNLYVGDTEQGRVGYILQKAGDKICLYYADEIVAAVYREYDDNNRSLTGYYADFAGAVSAVNAQEDKNTGNYCIELLKDVGGNGTAEHPGNPVSLALPSTKAWVTVTSEADEMYTIYYTNHITLKSHLKLQNVELAPQKLVKKVYQPATLNITTGAFRLNLQCETADNCFLGNITGTGYTPAGGVSAAEEPAYVIGNRENPDGLTVSGKVQISKGGVKITGNTTVGGLINVPELIIEGENQLTCSGSLTTKQLTMEESGVVEGKAAISIGKIAVGELTDIAPKIITHRTKDNKSQLSITGKVQSAGGQMGIEVAGYNDSLDKTSDHYMISLPSGKYQLTVAATSKLADIKTEYLSWFRFTVMGDLIPDGSLVKYNGGVYCTQDESLQNNMVRLEPATASDEHTAESTWCLDLSQAAVEIKNLAETKTDYQVSFSDNITDTNVTDKNKVSAMAFPAANTCASVTYQGEEGSDLSIRFLGTSGWKPAGAVRMEHLSLKSTTADGTKAANLDVTLSSSKLSSPASCLELSDCRMISENGAPSGNINKITGVKNVTELTLDHTNLRILGTVTNVNRLSVSDSHLITQGTVTANRVELNDYAEAVQWDAFGTTTIQTELKTESFANNDSYIAANRVAKTPTKPTFVLNGTATVNGNPFIFRVYQAGKKATEVKDNAADTTIYRNQYKGEPLLIAPKADGDLFRAETFRNGGAAEGISELISYKNLDFSVINDDKAEMAVELERSGAVQSADSMTGLTYAKSFAQAVAIIDKANDTKASYTMTLLGNRTEEDSARGLHAVKTAKDTKDNPIYGTMTLPSKAAQVTIQGDSDSDLVIRYTGKLTPKCNLTFKEIRLVEGSIDSKKKWLPAKEHAPTVDMGNGKYVLTLPDNMITITAADKSTYSYTSLTAKQGGIVMNGSASVSGAVSVKNLTLSDDVEMQVSGALAVSGTLGVGTNTGLLGVKAMTIGTISGKADSEGSPAVMLTTYRTALSKTNKVSKTQLTINGQVEADTDIHMMLYDATLSAEEKDQFGLSYRDADEVDMADFFVSSLDKPTDAQKIAVIAKASLEHVLVETDDSYLGWKHEKGLYVTDGGIEYCPILVTGTAPETGQVVYQASFMTWAQAVKEIDTANASTRDYVIELRENIGSNASVGTLTMPAKAKSVTIRPEYNDETGRAIFFTGTTITLKCPTTFERVALVAVKKKTSGKLTWYDSVTYKISAGNYRLTMKNMKSGGDFEYGTSHDREWLEALPGVITGTAKAAFIYQTSNTERENRQRQMATQVTNFGTFTVEKDWEPDPQKEWTAYCTIPSGISGVGTLTVDSDVMLESVKGNISTKNGQINGLVRARNFTSTGTLYMNKGTIDTGVFVKNTVTGAVKLKNLVLQSVDNQIIGRQNKSNQSQIVISGSVTTTQGQEGAAYDETTSGYVMDHAPAVIGLTYYSRNEYVQMYENMLILQSAKTSAENAGKLFTLKYSGATADDEWIDGVGEKPEEEDGYYYTLVKSGKTNILYQRAVKPDSSDETL